MNFILTLSPKWGCDTHLDKQISPCKSKIMTIVLNILDIHLVEESLKMGGIMAQSEHKNNYGLTQYLKIWFEFTRLDRHHNYS
jgi:hypothetical protein